MMEIYICTRVDVYVQNITKYIHTPTEYICIEHAHPCAVYRSSMINNALNSSDSKQEELGISDAETSQNFFSNANWTFGS